MAFRSLLPEEDLSCPVCCDIFKDPVLLGCSHSFCEVCLQVFWKGKEEPCCPVCRRRSSRDNPPLNRALKNLCQSVVNEQRERASKRSEVICGVHGEQFKLFCLDDQEPVCVVCQASKKHKNHDCSPVDEAAPDRREELENALKPLQAKLKVFHEVKQNCEKTTEAITTQAIYTEKKIRETFQTLHQFLHNREKEKIAALWEEVVQKRERMSRKIEDMAGEIQKLSDTIKAIEQELRTEDVPFLRNYKATVRRALCILPDPQLVSGVLVDVAKHLGNLAFKVWEEMKTHLTYAPVILDPNTAHPKLVLSEGLTCVRVDGGQRQLVPDNLERFDNLVWVMGSEGFNSGTHSWDIEVVNNTFWNLGVVAESVQRKKHMEGGYWIMGCLNGKYTVGAPPKPSRPLLLKHKPRKIRLKLDWDKGTLSFSDPDRNSQLHSLTCSFTETVFPYVGNYCSVHPLRILPGKAQQGN
ncbi:zinc-binding protein A33-like [Aplochiton taeniatus]